MTVAKMAWVNFWRTSSLVGTIFLVKAIAWSKVDIPPKEIIKEYILWQTQKNYVFDNKV